MCNIFTNATDNKIQFYMWVLKYNLYPFGIIGDRLKSKKKLFFFLLELIIYHVFCKMQ